MRLLIPPWSIPIPKSGKEGGDGRRVCDGHLHRLGEHFSLKHFFYLFILLGLLLGRSTDIGEVSNYLLCVFSLTGTRFTAVLEELFLNQKRERPNPPKCVKEKDLRVLFIPCSTEHQLILTGHTKQRRPARLNYASMTEKREERWKVASSLSRKAQSYFERITTATNQRLLVQTFKWFQSGPCLGLDLLLI